MIVLFDKGPENIGSIPDDIMETQAMAEDRRSRGDYLSGTSEMNCSCMHDSCDCLYRNELTPEAEEDLCEILANAPVTDEEIKKALAEARDLIDGE